MTNHKRLSTLSIARDTSIISAKCIARSSLSKFRLEAFASDAKRNYPGAEALSLDGYDEFALHLLYEHNRKICGAARIVKSIDGRLPFCSHFTDVMPKRGDYELSRFVTRAERDGKKAFLYLLPMIAYSFLNVPIREDGYTIFADVLTGYPRTLNRNTYIEFGFQSTGHEAFDHDYGLSSELFFLRPGRFSLFIEKCFKYQERIGRVRIANHHVQDVIHDVLSPVEALHVLLQHDNQRNVRRRA